MKVTGATRAHLLAFSQSLITTKQGNTLEMLLSRREQGEPIAYLIGEREFWSLSLRVSVSTLIPRPETEHLVQCALNLSLPIYTKALDLGAGSGAITLALAVERPKWNIVGIDRLSEAISLCRANALQIGVKNVQFYKGDWFKFLKRNFYHLIVSNPPYLKEGDPFLTQGDVRFEPREALIAGKDGLKDLEFISKYARDYLRKGGWLILEHGWKQGPSVRRMFSKFGFEKVNTIKDYSGNERVSQGKWMFNR